MLGANRPANQPESASLVAIETPLLPMLVSRATGSAMPVPRFRSVWDAFLHLTDVNAPG